MNDLPMTTPRRDPPYSRAGCIALFAYLTVLLAIVAALIWWVVL